jgi:hypothetical protein
MAIHTDETLRSFPEAVEKVRAERAGTLDAVLVREMAAEIGLTVGAPASACASSRPGDGRPRTPEVT